VHWSIPDPALARWGEATIYKAFVLACHLLQQRIGLLFTLSVAASDRLALSSRLDAIGKNGWR
jgi:arsenate reductase